MCDDISPIVQKRELNLNDPSYGSPDPMKTDSQLSLETQNPDNLLSDLKKKNHKNLSINIPDKNKYLEYQMSALKNSNNFQAVPTNTVKLPSPHKHMRMQSPLIKPAQSPITKSTNQIPSTFTKGLKSIETPNLFFNNNEYFFGQNYESVKTPELPSFLDPTPMSHANQMHQAHMNQMAHMTPMTSAQMNPQMMNQQMMNQQMMNQQLNPQMNAQINAQLSMNAQMNINAMNANAGGNMNSMQVSTPNPMSVNTNGFKLGGFFDSLDSPYTKYNFNQKMFYPLMGFNPGAGTEEGFSPFLKSNMALDINNTNSNVAKKEKNSFFTFKSEMPGGKGEGFEGNHENGNTGNGGKGQDNFEEKMRPKKKLKVV
jgi:hypothetical protein